MTNSNNVRPVSAPRTLTQRSIVVALALAGLAGCSSIGNMLEGDRIDYKSAEKARGPRLEVPPDLTQLQRDNRYAIPEANKGVATASGYQLEQQNKPTPMSPPWRPPKGDEIRIERDGSQRWLVVKQTPEQLWPQIKDFWQDSGFLINIESPDTGVMETDWAENRAKIPQDFIRNTLGKVFDSLYSTGERDKFRTRLERGPNGTTEIFISHRGAEEVLTGSAKETSVWTARPSDPGLEAEFLSRLMVRLGAEETKAKAAVANAPRCRPARACRRPPPAPACKSMKASTAHGAVSAWRWIAWASPWKTATAARASTTCATWTRTRTPRTRRMTASSRASSAPRTRTRRLPSTASWSRVLAPTAATSSCRTARVVRIPRYLRQDPRPAQRPAEVSRTRGSDEVREPR
jgi:uncharacterized lipoprotein